MNNNLDEERFLEFYMSEIFLNSPPELFKVVDAKTREDGVFTGEEEDLAECLSYWASEELYPMDNPENMSWEEIMNRAQAWARELC